MKTSLKVSYSVTSIHERFSFQSILIQFFFVCKENSKFVAAALEHIAKMIPTMNNKEFLSVTLGVFKPQNQLYCHCWVIKDLLPLRHKVTKCSENPRILVNQIESLSGF